MNWNRTWLVKRYKLIIFMDDLGQYIHYWSLMSDSRMNDSVTLLNLVVDADALGIDGDFAVSDRFTIILIAKRLELNFIHVVELFINPSTLRKCYELVIVRLDEPQTITMLIFTLLIIHCSKIDLFQVFAVFLRLFVLTLA